MLVLSLKRRSSVICRNVFFGLLDFGFRLVFYIFYIYRVLR